MTADNPGEPMNHRTAPLRVAARVLALAVAFAVAPRPARADGPIKLVPNCCTDYDNGKSCKNSVMTMKGAELVPGLVFMGYHPMDRNFWNINGKRESNSQWNVQFVNNSEDYLTLEISTQPDFPAPVGGLGHSLPVNANTIKFVLQPKSTSGRVAPPPHMSVTNVAEVALWWGYTYFDARPSGGPAKSYGTLQNYLRVTRSKTKPDLTPIPDPPRRR
jgi:hypothetical protein